MKVIQGNLNTDLLKLIGIVTMAIDHIGKVFYSDNIWFQLIGRITFPIFAYSLVIGFLFTSNFNKYWKRLAIFAIISQPFYIGAFEYEYYDLNIFFTLLLGLISIHFISKKQWLLYFLILIISTLIKLDYGIQGILMINIIYVFRTRRLISILLLVVHFSSLLFIDINEILKTIILSQELSILPSPSLNVFGIVAIVLMYSRLNFSTNLKIERSFFYIFYPAHLFILMVLKNLVLMLSI